MDKNSFEVWLELLISKEVGFGWLLPFARALGTRARFGMLELRVLR